MSDTRLRDLQRQWEETCTARAHAAYLAERVRAGDLDLRLLQLAAYCGHGAALSAAGATKNPRHTKLPIQRVTALVNGLRAWPPRVATRAHLVVQRFFLEAPRPDPVSEDRVAPNALLLAGLEALEAWWVCPCGSHAQEALAHGLLPREILAAARDSKAAAAFAARATARAAAITGSPIMLEAQLCQDLSTYALGTWDAIAVRVSAQGA